MNITYKQIYDAAINQGLSIVQAMAVVTAAKRVVKVYQETQGLPLDADQATNETGLLLYGYLAQGLMKIVEMPDLYDGSTWKWGVTEKGEREYDAMTAAGGQADEP